MILKRRNNRMTTPNENQKHECEFCGHIGTDVIWEPDPFASDVYDDNTEHWICSRCHQDRADDV